MKEMKRVLALVLCLAMLIGVLPVGALAKTAEIGAMAHRPNIGGLGTGHFGLPDDQDVPEESTEATDPGEETTAPSEETVAPAEDPSEPAADLSGAFGSPDDDSEEDPTEESTQPSEPEGVVARTIPGYVAPAGYTVVDAAVVMSDLHIDRTDDKTNMDAYKQEEVEAVMDALKQSGLPITSVTSAGDMFSVNEDYKGTPTGYTSVINGFIRGTNGLGDSSVAVNYVWSDHDRTAVQEDDKTLLDKTSRQVFANGNYYVYALSMGDLCSYDRYTAGFNYTASSNSARKAAGFTATVDEAIENFKTAVAGMAKDRPLLIVSHQPLFDRRNDNAHAEKWFAAINKVAEEMDVFFFFGHNHKYDESADYYYAEDASMPVALDDNWNYQYDVGGGPLGYLPNIDLPSDSKELNFTHLCAGYLEPTSTNSYDKNGTRLGTVLVAVMLVDGNGNKAVNLVTYDANGEYTGKFSQNQLVLCDEINKANVPETPVVPETPDVPQELKPVADTNGTGITVKGEGIEGVAAGQIMNPDYDEEAYTAYAAFEITVSGTYTNGTEATVTVPAPAGFDASKPVQVLYGGEVIATTKIVDGTITFTTDHFSTYAFAQGRAAIGEWVTITAPTGGTPEIPAKTEYKYVLDTDGVNTDKGYLIVNTSSNGDAHALTNKSGTATDTSVKITDGAILVENDTNIRWNFNSATSGTVSNDGRYVYPNNGSLSLDTNVRNMTIQRSGSQYRIYRTDTSNRKYFLRYNGGWTGTRVSATSSTTYSVYLFAYDSVVNTPAIPAVPGTGGLYGRIAGPTAINVKYGTSVEDAMAAVKAAIDVQTTEDQDNPEITDIHDTNVTWTQPSNYDADTPGTYDVVVKYQGVTLGTVTVIVDAKETSSVELLTPVINVKRNTSADADLVEIRVTYKEDNSTELLKLPLSMLQAPENGTPLDLTKNGSYPNLFLSYGGTTVTGITVNVVEKLAANNHPSYPNEGAVKVNKTATGIDFQDSGMAKVEISASGVPMKKGVDVVVMVDTSSSMDRHIDCGEKSCSSSSCSKVTRLTELKNALEKMEEIFKLPNADGTPQDIRVALGDFNGFFAGTDDNGSPYFRDSGDETTDHGALGGEYSIRVYTSTTNALDATAFVDAQDLDISKIFTKNQGSTGTNYDYAFDAIYQLVNAAQTQNAENGKERDVYVLFMSDGAPNQYNYYGSTGGTSHHNTEPWDCWNYWLTGAIGKKVTVVNGTETVTFNGTHTDRDTLGDIVKNANHHHYYDEETGNQHRMANAIKGTGRFEIIRKNNVTTGMRNPVATGEADMYMVDGLGVPMYSIAFTPTDDGDIREEAMLHILRDIATSEDYYHEVRNAGQLADVFGKIAGDIKNAAYNARFVDQMGSKFNMRMAVRDYESIVDGKTEQRSITPSVEILTYDIWTRAEFEAGKCDLEDIGTRKLNDEGVAEPKLKEVVIFNTNGTKAYSNLIDVDGDGKVGVSVTTDKDGNPVYGTNDDDDNILTGGVIYAQTFWYNSNATPVNLEDVNIPTNKNSNGTTSGSTTELPAETFYWKLGTVQTSELAMRYYVYLEDSLEGDREKGSYATNEFATLFYDNYLNAPCFKDTVSPVLAWEAATVHFAFYLVDRNGVPVNANGGQVGFADRVTIVNPTLYREILLNSRDGSEIHDLDVISSTDGLLPEGYVLFDNTATYKVTINSNGTGKWVIGGDSAKVDTTYVTGFNGNEFTKNKNVQTVGYDYTHTTVWFAVKMEPNPIPDTVVIDYGLSVDVKVLVNDMFGDFGTLTGVTADSVTAPTDKTTAYITSTSDEGQFGTAQVIAPAGATRENSVIRYKPFTEKGQLIMTEPEVFSYAAQYANPDADDPNDPYYGSNGFYHTTLTIIPATTIYYEDEYVELKSFTKNGSTWTENTESGWVTEKDDKYVSGEVVQDEDRPDDVNYGFDIPIDANNIYGYDSAYTNYSKYSLGSAAMINVDANKYGTASFDFYGTGFDIISLTSKDTGTITVMVKDEKGEVVRNTIVDTYYGMNKDGEITDNAADILYQVPVIKIFDLPYGKYTATIKAAYNAFFDNVEGSDSYDFYLDAIRIYDPTGNKNATANDAYAKDGESWPVYQELRNNVISAADYNNMNVAGGVLNGITFIDGDLETPAVADYVGYGPNNELYLAPGQAIVFGLDLDDYVKTVDNKTVSTVQAVHLAMKAETGDNVNVAIFDAAKSTDKATIQAAATTVVSSATDLYYDITNLKDTAIIVYNNGTGVMSMTNIKITFTDEPTEVSDIFYVDYETIEKVLGALQTVEPGEDADPEAPWVDATLPEIVKSGKTFEIEGNVYDATSLTVHGETVSFNEDGSWKTSVTLTKSSLTNGVETQEIEIIASNGELSTPITAYVDVYYFEPATFKAEAVTSTVQKGDPATIKVTTGNDVAKVVVKDTTLTTYRVNKAGTERIWTAEVYLGDGTNGTATADVYVYNAEGHEANTVKTVYVTVNSDTTEGNKIAATVAQTIKKLINSFVDSLSNWFTRSK